MTERAICIAPQFHISLFMIFLLVCHLEIKKIKSPCAGGIARGDEAICLGGCLTY